MNGRISAGTLLILTSLEEEYSTIRVAKKKTLISCAVTAQLICVFVFAYANCWLSHAQAQFLYASVSSGGSVSKEENDIMMSIFKIVSEGSDSVLEQFYDEDNPSTQNWKLDIFQIGINEYMRIVSCKTIVKLNLGSVLSNYS